MNRTFHVSLPLIVLGLSLHFIGACGSETLNLRTLDLGHRSQDHSKETANLTGNGTPAGKHYNLNVIGVPKDKSATITSGNRIFLPLLGRTRINLSQGEFAVLDANGTDGTAAFQLPAPDADGDSVTSYSVVSAS